MPFYRFEELPDVRHNPDLSTGHGPTVKGERIFFGKRRKRAGTGSKPHYHPNEQFLYVLKGRLRSRVGDEERVVGPGGVVHIPAYAVHTNVAEGEEDAEYLYVKDTTWSMKGVPAGEAAPEEPPGDDPF